MGFDTLPLTLMEKLICKSGILGCSIAQLIFSVDGPGVPFRFGSLNLDPRDVDQI